MDPEIFKTIPFENKKATRLIKIFLLMLRSSESEQRFCNFLTLKFFSSVRSSNKPKLVIFILGGVCASEMRCAYEVSNQLPQEPEEKSWFSFSSKELTQFDVFIGSTHISHPIQQMKVFATN